MGGKQPPFSTSPKLYVRLEPTDLRVRILVTALAMLVRGSTRRKASLLTGKKRSRSWSATVFLLRGICVACFHESVGRNLAA